MSAARSSTVARDAASAPRGDWYYWRLLATGLSFTVFGLGGLALSVLVFPWLLLLSKERRTPMARWCVQRCFGTFLSMMCRLGIMRLEIIGREKLQGQGGQLIIANHPTLIDVVALISVVPNASCVVKRALWNNPFMGGVVRAADYISNADSDAMLRACAHDIQGGRQLIVFPEGTRTVPQQALKFQRGASYIALYSDRPVVPVLIHCQPDTLTKGAPWYRIPHRRFTLRLEVLDAIDPRAWVVASSSANLQARQLTRAFEDFFTENLRRYG